MIEDMANGAVAAYLLQQSCGPVLSKGGHLGGRTPAQLCIVFSTAPTAEFFTQALTNASSVQELLLFVQLPVIVQIADLHTS